MKNFSSDLFSGDDSVSMSFFSAKLYKIPNWFNESKKVSGKIKSIRAEIVSAIQKMVQLNDLNLTELSMQSKLPKPTLSAVLKGKTERISTDRLLTVACTLGLKVGVKVSQFTK